MQAPAILEFELSSGKNADAIIAARALIEWAEAIKAAARVIDPSGDVSIDLISAEPACLRFSAVLNFIEQNVLAPVAEKLEPYPRIKQILALNVLILPGAIIGGIAVNAFSDDPDVAEKQRQVAESPAVQGHVESFYKIVHSDPAIKRVVVRETRDGPPVMSVNQSEFAERSGLWAMEEDAPSEREGGGVWNVIVTRPVAIAKPYAWGFMRDGLPFRAKMVDEQFLEAMKLGTLPITLQEGVTMEVRVSYRERLEGQLWIPVPGTYKIVQVLNPKP
ncbi:hypothetical protein [Novosphingobium kaempferiae]|uniref:hypothetical protein n=1 Tax=Novosphingobium kaempferiae TaxID=2896849 RepID=UPI001E634F4A|nr:hypothetical protein [Novosphingobium kaempferiae]